MPAGPGSRTRHRALVYPQVGYAIRADTRSEIAERRMHAVAPLLSAAENADVFCPVYFLASVYIQRVLLFMFLSLLKFEYTWTTLKSFY